MTQKELQDGLSGLYDENPAHFAIKQFKDGEDIWIEANRNGILGFCRLLLQSIDKKHLEKTDTYDFPDAFWDDSDIALSVRIEERNKSRQQFKQSFMEQAGCFLAIAAFVVVLIVGVVTSFGWLVKFLN